MEKVGVFDIEATNWTEFACLGFYDGTTYTVFWSIEGFLDHLLTKKYRGWQIYAHFGGKYDFRFLIPVLVDEDKYELRFIERGSKILSLKVKDMKNKRTWRFCDSYFLLPTSLKKLGEAFDVEHVKKDFDVEGVQNFNTPEAQAYLKNDVLGLYEILHKFSTWGLNGGKLKLTLPSQSMHIFSNKFLDRELVGLSEPQENFIRKTYFGGRVEIFQMSGENLFYYDFNSLYPTVMFEDMPVGKPMATKEYQPNKIGFYKIKAFIPSTCLIPPLPTLINNKLFFPCGTGEFYVSSADIQTLIKMNISFDVIEGMFFSDRAPIFKEYIRSMYKIKQDSEHDSMDYLLAKLFMNSLYGKFGQKRNNQELIHSHTPPMGALPYDEKFGLYIIDKVSKGKFILPYLASYITSLARMKLYSVFQKVGFKNVWYCDTDSIITDKKLNCGEELGELKLEYEIKKAVFLQPKAYALKLHDGKEIIKIKGMREGNLKFKNFENALRKNDMSEINTTYFNIMGFRECIRRNRSLKITRAEVHKRLNSLYNKRIIKNNLTQPHMYDNLLSVK